MQPNRPWPAWHPKEELTAEHLLGLEEYLLARARTIDADAHGVDRFHWQAGLSLEWAEDGPRCTVRRLFGVTPAGEPVFVSDSAPLTLLGQGNGAAGVGAAWHKLVDRAHWDVSIEVNQRQNAEAEEGIEVDNQGGETSAKPGKLQLQVAMVVDADAPTTASQNRLYLGRYKLEGGHHVLVIPPMVRRLGGLEPRDSKWEEWVAPFHKRLEGLLRQAERAGVPTSLTQHLVSSELVRLAFEWPSTPIPMLAHRLRFVTWLNARSGGAVPLDDFSSSLPEPFPPRNLTGGELPNALKELLPSILNLSSAQINVLDQREPTAGRELISALAMRDIDYFAPLDLLSRWVSELDRVESSALETSAALRMLEALTPSSTTRRSSAESLWVRVVRLVSAVRVEQCLSGLCPAPLAERITGDGSVRLTDATATAFSQLVDSAADERRAGPIALYWITKAIARCSPFRSALSPMAASYVTVASGETPDPQKVQTGSARRSTAARSFGYLNLQRDRAAPRELRPTGRVGPATSRLGVAASRSQLSSMGPSKTMRIALVGPDSSGKAAMSLAIGQSGRILLQSEEPVSVPGGSFDVCEINTSTDSGLTAAERQLVQGAELVLLVLDPACIARNHESGAGALRGLLEAVDVSDPRTHGGALAIVYSKADEYGVVSQETQRLVDAKQIATVARLPDPTAWSQLLLGASSDWVRDGGARIRRPGAVDYAGECAPTRNWVLEGTRSLWNAVARHAALGRFLNGYFVCANPIDTRFDIIERRGLAQLLSDYVGYLRIRQP